MLLFFPFRWQGVSFFEVATKIWNNSFKDKDVFRETLTQYLFLLGMQCTSAAFASAFINMNPVFTFLLAIPLRQESVNFQSTRKIAKVLGSLICMGGAVVLIVYRGTPLNKTTYSKSPSYNLLKTTY